MGEGRKTEGEDQEWATRKEDKGALRRKSKTPTTQARREERGREDEKEEAEE